MNLVCIHLALLCYNLTLSAKKLCTPSFTCMSINLLLGFQGTCKRGDACPFAHGVFESWLHPGRYVSLLNRIVHMCKADMNYHAHERVTMLLHIRRCSGVPTCKMGQSGCVRHSMTKRPVAVLSAGTARSCARTALTVIAQCASSRTASR